MDTERVRLFYQEKVIPYFKYRLGGELAHRIAAHVATLPWPEADDERACFVHLLEASKAFCIEGHQVLSLVLEPAEYREFDVKFLRAFDEADPADQADAMAEVFDNLVAGYLEDILGAELVETVRQEFIKAVSGVPDQSMEVRFYIGMQAIYHAIPGVWSELEFAEKVKELSLQLPRQQKVQESMADGQADFDDVLERVIIRDLADILGRGHALETVIRTAKDKTGGIFYDQQDRFITFVNNLLEDDFLSRMFDGYWIEERRRQWIEEANLG
jgi:hypothetical protein